VEGEAMTLEEVAGKLAKAKRAAICQCPGYNACCPAHDDKSPSFGVWETHDGWIKFKCQKGCTEDAIMRSLGMTTADKRVYPNGHVHNVKPDTSYIYRDADGSYLFEKHRWYKPDGKKTFSQRVKKDKGYENNLSSLHEKAKTFYHLPEVLKAIEKGKTIYVNEGEKAVESFRQRGYTATCQPGGAHALCETKWLPMHTEALRGANVVVVADNDKLGKVFAAYIVEQLTGVAKSVVAVQPKCNTEKADAFDHFAEGYDVGDFVPMEPWVEPKTVLKSTTFTEETFEPIELDYLWEPRMPRGKMVLWDADGGTQKTTLLLAVAAGFSIGKLPCGDGDCDKVKTAYFHKGEDDSAELATVYRANYGDLSMIEFFEDQAFCLSSEGLKVLEDTLVEGGFTNVVFDALIYFCSHLQREAWKDPQAILPVLHGLSLVARRTNCTINNIRHTTKGAPGKAASELGFGSVQFRNSHRGQMVMRYHPDVTGLIVVTDEKGSLLSARGDAFAFRRQGGEVLYVSNFDNPFDAKDTYATRLDVKKKAQDWLRAQLSTGPKLAADVVKAGEVIGYQKRTLQRALRDIGGITSKDNFKTGWVWSLGGTESQIPMYWKDKEDDDDPFM